MDGEARLLTLDEVFSGVGSGWMELMYKADPDEGETEDWTELCECAYLRGCSVQSKDEFTMPDMMRQHYGKKYGFRIWTACPTREQAVAAAWE